MSEVTKDEYQAALTIVAQAEKTTVTSLKDLVEDTKAKVADSITASQTLQANLPNVAGPSSAARSTVSSIASQLTSLMAQLSSMQASLNSLLIQYDGGLPGSTPATYTAP